jgi:carbonic anhydrase
MARHCEAGRKRAAGRPPHREHPLVPRNIPIYGYVYDVKSGRLNEVAKATEVGRASPRAQTSEI